MRHELTPPAQEPPDDTLHQNHTTTGIGPFPNVTVTEQSSQFDGTVKILVATPQPDHDPIADPNDKVGSANYIFFGQGAGWDQERATLAEIARQKAAYAFSVVPSGRTPDTGFVTGERIDTAKDAILKTFSRREIKKILKSNDNTTVIARQQLHAAASLLAAIEVLREENSTPAKATDSGAHPNKLPAPRKIDAILQSESTAHGLIAAYTAPEQFNHIVLAFPGGLSGRRKGFMPGRLIRDALARRRHKPAPDNDFRGPNQLGTIASLKAQLGEPDFRANAYALNFADLSHLLHSLRQRAHAPKVTLVAGLDDGIFKLKDYFKNLVDASDVDRIVIIPGGHAITGRKNILATIVDQLRDNLPAHWPRTTKSTTPEAPATASTPHTPLHDRIVFAPGIPERRMRKVLQLAEAVDKRSQLINNHHEDRPTHPIHPHRA